MIRNANRPHIHAVLTTQMASTDKEDFEIVFEENNEHPNRLDKDDVISASNTFILTSVVEL